MTASLFAACVAPLLGMGSAQAATTSNTAADRQFLAADGFYRCSQLKLDAARLACFDKVLAGEELTLGREKTPLDLAGSVRATLSDRRPTAVFAENENDEDPEEYKTGAVTAAGDERLSKAGITVDDFAPYTPLSLAYDLDKNSENGTWTVRPHNAIYLLPAFAHFNPNRNPSTPTQPVPDAVDYEDQYDPLELKAQISLKTKIAEDVFDTNADVWFGYTQQMHWQVYNKEYSRPFRATDYMPEVFITQPVKADLPFNGRLRMLGAGAIHHSNGQSDPLSRSWNRIYLMGGAEWGKFSIVPKVWYHVKQSDNSRRSDNPDITDYYGHGEVQALYDFGKGESLAATGRYNLATNKGAIQVDYTHPITRDLHAFIQLFHGYGESIIDYNEDTTAVGVGLSLNDWKGL
ncbi:phospholipase A [Psychrobacter sp. FDAARGOS_221]|uniref:phospholipase A n=1 Tax=Psychrobacter sp. FDAARGOS_221 TaxID=1975705 RepID=UPI001D0D0D35|nr:phospholipase A [Psychrobacter sp. FDAARGOS_221]